MTAIKSKAAAKKPKIVPSQIGGIGAHIDCLAYMLWVEKWLRSNGENRLADDYAEVLRDGETVALAA